MKECKRDRQNRIGCAGKGYTFSTWLRLEKLAFDPSTAGQSLFCFLHGSGSSARGVAAALQGMARSSVQHRMSAIENTK